MKWLVMGLVTIVVVMGGWIIKEENFNAKKTYTVNRVIDGDTVVVDNNQVLRLSNVDAPEKGMCGFEEAKEVLEKMLSSKKINIKGETNDQWGRLIVSMWLGKELVNEKMIRTGWVRYDSQGDNKYLKEIDDETERRKVGIYGKCREETNTIHPNCLIKGNNREGTVDHIYILPGCKGYTNTKIATDRGDKWFCSESEAIVAGYKKALNCD